MVYNTPRGGPRARPLGSNLETDFLVPSSVSINKGSRAGTWTVRALPFHQLEPKFDTLRELLVERFSP